MSRPPKSVGAAAPGEAEGGADQPGKVDTDSVELSATVAPATESALMGLRRARRDAKRAAGEAPA